MSEKFTMQILNEDGSMNYEKKYKSYREIAKELNLEYHVVRALEQLSDKKVTRKYLHPALNSLSKKVRIFQKIQDFEVKITPK